jgi:hypothetical protein
MSKGSCLCSSVIYEIHGEPLFFNVCHCINCQKFGGSAMAANLVFLEEQITIKDPMSLLKAYEDHSGGDLTRYFCSQCGSSVLVKSPQVPGMPRLTFLMSGTVDDLSEKENKSGTRWVPMAELNCAGKRAWFPRVTGVPENMCFEKVMSREVVALMFQNVQTQK